MLSHPVRNELDSLLAIFEKLIENADLKEQFKDTAIDMKQALAFFLDNAMGKNAQQFLRELEPRHVQQLMVALVLTLKQNEMALNNKNFPKLNELVEKLQKLMPALGLTPGIKPTKEEAEKLKLAFMDILKDTNKDDLKADLIKLFTVILVTMKDAKLYEPKPGSSVKDDAEELANIHAKSGYSNLLGLAANMTGAIAVTISCYIGNGLGFPDFDPFNGFNPMARQNDPYDSQIDSFNASAVYTAITNGDSALATEFKEQALIHAYSLQPGH